MVFTPFLLGLLSLAVVYIITSLSAFVNTFLKFSKKNFLNPSGGKDGLCHLYRSPTLVNQTITGFCRVPSIILAIINFNSSQTASTNNTPHIHISFLCPFVEYIITHSIKNVNRFWKNFCLFSFLVCHTHAAILCYNVYNKEREGALWNIFLKLS